MSILLPQSRRGQEQFLRDLIDAVRLGSLGLVVGAGVSISAGLPTWQQLVNRMAELGKLGSDIGVASLRPETSARYLAGKLRPQRFHRILRRALYESYCDGSPLLKAVVDLARSGRVSRVVSSNYDDLLEEKLEALGVSIQAVYDGRAPRQPGAMQIVHIHGFVPRLSSQSYGELIFTEEDYNRLYNSGYNWQTLELLDVLRHGRCVFVGHSLEDPNMRRVIDLYRSVSPGGFHSALIVDISGHVNLAADEILKSMGITAEWVSDPDEVAEIIQSALEFGSRP